MINPLDNSDLANLVLADWHEEYGDIDYANEIRESVLEPKINSWHWSDGVSLIDGDKIGGRNSSVGGETGSGDIVGSSSGGVGAYDEFAGGGDK